MEVKEDDFGAFIQKFQLLPPPHPSPSRLPLHGLTFAVKDIFDIAGYVTGFGNPDWARTHAAALSTAPAIMSVLEAGGICLGKTIMDEMAFSINGENKHYGTPVNPCAPDRVPGGSSSGSAVAVAAKLVDFSLGSDTGGSVRVPAAYCGILGFRPSHAAVSTTGVIPMAPSFDTVGWFARDPRILNQVGRVLLNCATSDIQSLPRLIVADDCFQLLSYQGDQICQVLSTTMCTIFGVHDVEHVKLGDYISAEVPSLKIFMPESIENQGHGVPSLSALSNAMRLLQRIEFKSCHGDWVTTVQPDLGPEISERVSITLKTTYDHVDEGNAVRSELKVALGSLLEHNGVLAIPTIVGPPPKLHMEAVALEHFRAKAFSLLSIAGMSGFCQVTIPLGMQDNLPVSVSLMGKHGADGFLLDLVQTLYGTLTEAARSYWKVG